MTEPSLVAQPVLQDRHVETPHGTIYVKELPGLEPAVVLLHGFPDDHTIYARLMPLLAPQRILAIDYLGHGRSDRPDEAGVSMADHADQIDAVLDALDIQQAVIVGHDASGPDAVTYALNHPERTHRVVLLNTIFGNQPSLRMPEMTRLFADPQLATLSDDLTGDPAQLLWLLQRWGAQWRLDSEPDGIAMGSIVPQFFGNDAHPSALPAIRRWTADLHTSLAHQDALIADGTIHELAAPVSIIWGVDDPYLNSCLANELQDVFGAASLDLVADAGHYPQHDQPHAVADLIRTALLD